MSTAFKPPHTPTLLPYLTVRDGQKALDFYQAAFGFSLDNPPSCSEDGKIQHVEMRFGETLVMFCPEGAFGTTAKAPATTKTQIPLTLYVYCEDVDRFYQRAIGAGATALVEPMDAFWGDRMCKLSDPDGYEWIFATYLGTPHHG